MPTIKIEGLKKLSKELGKIQADLPKELKKVGKDAAEIVATETRSTAPHVTGRLARSIKTGSTAGGAYVRTGVAVPYAKPIVYGVGSRAGLRGPHNIRPNPFPYQAADRRRDEVIERYSRNVAALIDKSVQSGTGE